MPPYAVCWENGWKDLQMQIMTTVPELASQMHKDPAQLYAWAKRDNDPLPLRYVGGERYGAVIVREFEEWFIRNSVLMSERNEK